MSLLRNAFSRLHYPIDVIAQCVRWYLAYSLSLRNLEEMMAERGIIVSVLKGASSTQKVEELTIS
jgi:putative transposase